MTNDTTPAPLGADALRVAAQAALTALENLHEIDTETECITIDVRDEIDALRAALVSAAQPAAARQQALENVALLADILNRRPAMNAGLAEAYAHWTAEVYDLMGAIAAEPAYAAAAPKAAPAPAAAAGQLNELEELNLLNNLIHLGARAASAHAKSNSDDGHAGTASYVEWSELRADMGELIRMAYATPAPAAQGDALDAARYRYLTLEMGSYCITDAYENSGGVLKAGAADAAIDAARAAKDGDKP